jgi:hypothetical protein
LGSRLAFDALPDELDGRPTIHQEASARARELPDDADEAAGRDRGGDESE